MMNKRRHVPFFYGPAPATATVDWSARFLYNGDLVSEGDLAIGTGTYARASAVNYWDSSTTMASAGVNTAVFEYLHPVTGDEEGWFRNDVAVTNSLANTDLTNGAWAFTNVGTRAQDATGPLGANTAFTIVDNNASTTELLEDTACPNDSNTHIFHMLWKKTSTPSVFPEVRLSVTGGTFQIINAQLNTETGATNTRSITGTGTQGVIDRGDWWQWWITIKNNSTGNTTARLKIYPVFSSTLGGAGNGALTGTQIVAQPQLQLNSSYPLPFVECAGSATSTVAATSYYPRWDQSTATAFKNIFDPTTNNAEGAAVASIVWPTTYNVGPSVYKAIIRGTDAEISGTSPLNCGHKSKTFGIHDGTSASTPGSLTTYTAFSKAVAATNWTTTGNQMNAGAYYGGSWQWDATPAAFDGEILFTGNNFLIAPDNDAMYYVKDVYIYSSAKSTAYIEANH